jgi:hypothetical protein
MATTYPGTIQTFSNPAGTSTLDSPDHAGLHSDVADTMGAAQTVMGTTAGTSVLKDFAAGQFPARVNAGGTIVQTLTGGTINTTTMGTPTVVGGTFGTTTTTGGTTTSQAINTPTITTPVIRNYDGWIDANESWAYASASTITVPSGAVAKYAKGDKIKLTQTTVKYFYVIGVADTVLTVTGGSDYTVANAAITANYYSHATSPIGFPGSFAYSPTIASQTGTLTTTSSDLKFSLEGKVLAMNGSVTITTAGTGSGYLQVSLPVTSRVAAGCGAGRENALTGITVQVALTGTTFIRMYSLTIADGAKPIFSITYEIA